MNKDLKDWLFMEFWPLYLSLCKAPYRTKWGAGDRGKAYKAIASMKPSKELKVEILDWIREVTRHRRTLYKRLGHDGYEKHAFKYKNEGIYCNKQASTFINGAGWFCEIPSITEMKVTNVIPIIEKKCACGGTAGPSGVCSLCYYKQA